MVNTTKTVFQFYVAYVMPFNFNVVVITYAIKLNEYPLIYCTLGSVKKCIVKEKKLIRHLTFAFMLPKHCTNVRNTTHNLCRTSSIGF